MYGCVCALTRCASGSTELLWVILYSCTWLHCAAVLLCSEEILYVVRVNFLIGNTETQSLLVIWIRREKLNILIRPVCTDWLLSGQNYSLTVTKLHTSVEYYGKLFIFPYRAMENIQIQLIRPNFSSCLMHCRVKKCIFTMINR